MRGITPLHLLMTAFICLLFMAPVTAQDNPYQNAGTVTEYDIPITLDSTDTITNSAFDSLMAGSSDNNPKAIGSDIVAFNGAGYSYRIGRVTITMNPLDMKSKESARIKGNMRSYGSDPVFEHEVYRDLIKERVILNSPRTLQYAYSLKLSDWVTREPDMSQPVEVQGADGTISVTYPHIKEVTTHAADSTIDINPDPWGNLEVSVNDESVVVMPQPFAIDADGKRFELAYLLDKEAGTITITGDLTDAKYPVTIDPTERVTNGGFETGDTTGWWKSDAPELIVFSSEPYQGSYYCRYTGNGLSGFAGYTRMYQTIDYTGVPRVFGAVKIRSPNPYNFYLSDGYWDETANYSITFPKTPATGWVIKNATTNRSSTGKIAIWTHGSSSADIDSIRAIGFNTPVVQFTGSPASGTAPLTVYFTDQSTNSPTSWSWNFGDGGTSTAQHPSHTYTSSGTYTVRLTASNAEGTGDPSTKTNYISVSAPLPNAQFTASPTTGTAPLTVYFTDQSTNSPTSWSWNFGDGETSTAQSPSHIYTSSGTYTVSLTVANAAGSDAETKQNHISVTCPSSCDATLTNPPYIDFDITRMRCPEDHGGDWWDATCLNNAVIRWSRAGDSQGFYTTLLPWMWKRSSCCPDPGYSWAFNSPAGKRIFIAGLYNPEIILDGEVFSHAVAAELLTTGSPESSTWQDWKFFNYGNTQLSIGDWQIPAGTDAYWTHVWIKSVDSFTTCGQQNGGPVREFYIAPNGTPFDHPRDWYIASYLKSQNLVRVKSIPDEVKSILESMKTDRPFSINRWEFDPATKELVVYAHDIKNERAISDYQNKPVGGYSIRVVHDTGFETTRSEVFDYLWGLRKNPDYQINSVSMITDRINDPPENIAEVWVYKSTPENKKLDNTEIQGWKIRVYPVSR